MDWPKLDATTYSWQKVMGSEAAHGMLILSPRAVERIESYDPPWPLPKIFRVKKGDTLNRAIFEGATINTPSLLATEDYIASLEWAKSIGGRQALISRADANAAVVQEWIDATPWVRNMVNDPAKRTNTGVCMVFQSDWYGSLSPEDQASVPKKIAAMCEERGVRLRFQRLSRCPAEPAHLVRIDRRNRRYRRAAALDRMGVQPGSGRAFMIPSPLPFRGEGWERGLSSFSKQILGRLETPPLPASPLQGRGGNHAQSTDFRQNESPRGEIFRERGCEVDEKVGLDPEELKGSSAIMTASPSAPRPR